MASHKIRLDGSVFDFDSFAADGNYSPFISATDEIAAPSSSDGYKSRLLTFGDTKLSFGVTKAICGNDISHYVYFPAGYGYFPSVVCQQYGTNVADDYKNSQVVIPGGTSGNPSYYNYFEIKCGDNGSVDSSTAPKYFWMAVGK